MKPQLWVSILATGVEPFDAKQTARRHFLAITRGLRGTRPYQRISPVYSGSLACGGRAEVLGSREILRRFGVARVRCGYSIGASGNPARLRPGRYLVLSWWRSCGYSLRRCCRQRPHRIDRIYSFNCPVCPILIAPVALPVLGIGYLLGMLIPTSLGAWLGPRLMRW